MGLVGAVQRKEDVLVGAAEPAQGQQLSADRHPTVHHPEVDTLDDRPGARRRRPLEQDVVDHRVLLGDHHGSPGLMMPAFCAAIVVMSSPSQSMWSMPTGMITATGASMTLVASQAPPSPTSTTATATGASANATKASTVSTSKYVSGRPPSASTISRKRFDVVPRGKQLLGRDRFAVDAIRSRTVSR